MKKYLNLLDFTIYFLYRKKWKNLSLILLFSYLVFLISSVLLLTGAIKAEAERGISGAPDIAIQKLAAGRQLPIPVSYAKKLDEIFGIESIVPRVWGYYFDVSTQANYTIIGYETGKETWKGLGQITAGDGNQTLNQGEAILGEGVIQSRHLKIGHRFGLYAPNFKAKSYKLVGAFKGSTNLRTYDVILLAAEDAREVLGMEEGLATDLAVYVYNMNEVTMIAKKISEALPGIRVVIKNQLARTYDTVYSWKSGFALITLVGCLLAFAMMVWEKASGISAEEKREIGILKATGWDTTDILIVKFWEAVGISLPSFLIGLVSAYVYVFVLGAPLLKSSIIGWSVLYPPFQFTPSIDPKYLMVLLFLTVVPYIIATIIPSWKAAIIDPDSVIRGV